MKFTLAINMDNAAFAQGNHELERILVDVARQIAVMGKRTRVEVWVRDINGNTVGEWRITPGRRPQ